MDKWLSLDLCRPYVEDYISCYILLPNDSSTKKNDKQISICLDLLSLSIKKIVLPYVLPYVIQHLRASPSPFAYYRSKKIVGDN